MKIKTSLLVSLFTISVLALAWCGKTEIPTDENAEIANPASVYCEENGGTLQIEEWEWLCMFNDGSYCEERSYYRGECQVGEIVYNTDESTVVSNIYSQDELDAAEAVIMDVVNNERDVKVESFKATYAGDEESANNLEYCQSLKPELEGCAVFTSSFHIPEQDVQMTWAFEPNANIDGWSWILGKNSAWEWEVLTNGFG